MNFALRFICNQYLGGEGVDHAADSLLDKICNPNDSRSSDVRRTTTKVAMYWSAISLVTAAMVYPVALSPAGALIGLALVPFAAPLYRNVKVLIEANKRLPLSKRVQIAAAWTTFACAQAGATYGLSRGLSSKEWILAAFIFSNLPVGGGLLANRAIFESQSEEISDADWIVANCRGACKRLEEEIRDLKAIIQRIDAFVAGRPDLRKIIQEHVEKYGEYIARPGTPPKIIVEGPDDWIRRRAVLQIQVDDVKFELNERKRFVQTHPEVRACFEKHVLAMRKGPGTIGEAKLIGVAASKLLSLVDLQIEEISGDSSSEGGRSE